MTETVKESATYTYPRGSLLVIYLPLVTVCFELAYGLKRAEDAGCSGVGDGMASCVQGVNVNNGHDEMQPTCSMDDAMDMGVGGRKE